jgi:hypothetical protein
MVRETANPDVQAGSYYFDQDNKLVLKKRPDTGDQIANVDYSMPPQAEVERLDFRIVTVENDNRPPLVLMIGGLHADEEEVPELAIKILAKIPYSRVESWNTHILASVLGMREAIVPVLDNEKLDDRQKIFIKNGRKAEENGGGVIGKKIDLNRQFKINSEERDFDTVISKLNYPEAKMLMYLMMNNPEIETVFSFHEDPEFGYSDNPESKPDEGTRDGFYLYDIAGDARNDKERETIKELETRLVKKLLDHNFKIHNGIDDPGDPSLGHRSENGLIYQPNVNEAAIRNIDGSFESAAVELGRLGINKVNRAFSFEIPKGLSRERKEKCYN